MLFDIYWLEVFDQGWGLQVDLCKATWKSDHLLDTAVLFRGSNYRSDQRHAVIKQEGDRVVCKRLST